MAKLRRGRTGAITVHLPAALPSRRFTLDNYNNCPLRWRPRALRAFPRGSANASPNSARARSGTPGSQVPPLTSDTDSGINKTAAVAATRGDLGQLAPRKKLLKSFSSFPEDFLRPSKHFGTEGFSFLPSLLP